MAILYNMLKGKITVYSFSIQINTDIDDVISELNKIVYSEYSPIELFHVKYKKGRLIISFTKNEETFVSVKNPTDDIIYTAKENDHTYQDFINYVYKIFDKLFKGKQIILKKEMHYNLI